MLKIRFMNCWNRFNLIHKPTGTKRYTVQVHPPFLRRYIYSMHVNFQLGTIKIKFIRLLFLISARAFYIQSLRPVPFTRNRFTTLNKFSASRIPLTVPSISIDPITIWNEIVHAESNPTDKPIQQQESQRRKTINHFN